MGGQADPRVERYRCVATSPGGFIQQLAVSYVGHGYWMYVTGEVPHRKDPRAVDLKLVQKYGAFWSSAERSRRKKSGRSNVQYLRYGRFFVLVATLGEHEFFTEERGRIRDFRRHPLRFLGYSISYRGGHPHVRIEEKEYRRQKAFLEELAVKRRVDTLSELLQRLPFESYALVVKQKFALLRAVNRRRKTAGLELVPSDAVNCRRRVYRPFEAGPIRSTQPDAMEGGAEEERQRIVTVREIEGCSFEEY